MKTKTVIQLDAEDYFVGVATADESPLEPGVYLIPGGAVDAPTPDVPQGQRARWTGQGWALEAIPVAPEPPAPEPPRRADIIRARLAAIDADSIRALRAVARGKAIKADTDKLDALDTEAAELRAELAALGPA